MKSLVLYSAPADELGLSRYFLAQGISQDLSDPVVCRVEEFVENLDQWGTDFHRVFWCAPDLSNLVWYRLLQNLAYRPLQKKTVLFGVISLGCPSTAFLSFLNDARSKGRLSLETPVVGESEETPVVGPPSARLRPPRLLNPSSKKILCPSEPTTPSDIANLWDKDSALLCSKNSDFDLAPSPGTEVFYSPYFPEHHGTALVSAAGVVASDSRILGLAIGNGIPCVSWGMKSPVEGVPCLGSSPSIGGLKEKWDQSMEQLGSLRNQWKEAGDAFLKPHQSTVKSRKGDKAPPIHFCSISDSNYLPFLLGFIENVRQMTGDNCVIHALALDSKVSGLLDPIKENISLYVYSLEELWGSKVSEIEKRPLGFRGFSSKARLAQKALQMAQGPVIYADSDVHFLKPPEEVVQQMDGQSVMLFPHWNDVYSAARIDGLFNAGMVAVDRGAERFLEWWDEMCFFQGGNDRALGTIGDQTHLDFAPILFENLKIYRGGDQNVARWNLLSLGVQMNPQKESIPRLKSGEPVGSFHCAFVDGGRIFEIKHCWDQLVTLFSHLDDPNSHGAFLHNVFAQQQAYWLSLSRAMAAQQVLGEWIPGVRKNLDIASARNWVKGSRKPFLRLFSGLRRILSQWRKVENTAEILPEWIRLQQKYLPRVPETVEIRKRTVA